MSPDPHYFSEPEIEQLLTNASALVFDLNGLIIDDEPLQLQATNEALAPFEIKISPELWISRCVGHKPAEYLPNFLFKNIDANVEQVIRSKDRIYSSYLAGRAVKTFERAGAVPLLRHAKGLGKKIALATSTTRSGASTALGEDGLDILQQFDVVVTGDEVDNAKPDPEIYNAVRSALGEEFRYLVLEDSSTGVRSAKAAGMLCLAVPNRFTAFQDFSIADAVVNGLEQDSKLIRTSLVRQLRSKPISP
jgi:beta-phosphoglucomutase-like phosphatase (HAD superfamily)